MSHVRKSDGKCICYLNPYSVFEASLVFLTAVCSAKTLSSKTEKYHKKKRGTVSTQVQSNQSVQLCEQLNAANQSVCSAPLFPLWTNTFKTNDISISLGGALCFFVPLSLSSSPALWITKLICTQTLHISHSLYVYKTRSNPSGPKSLNNNHKCNKEVKIPVAHCKSFSQASEGAHKISITQFFCIWAF